MGTEIKDKLVTVESMKTIFNELDTKIPVFHVFNCSLLVTEWSGDNAPFTQKVAVEGIASDWDVSFETDILATYVQRQAARQALLVITKKEDGILTISADGICPTINIPIVIRVQH